jgi:hypothetical protein
MPFPRKRFELAGATGKELAALEAEHTTLPEAMQAANEQRFATLDTAGLTLALEARREHGIPDVSVEKPDLEPLRAFLADVHPGPEISDETQETGAEADAVEDYESKTRAELNDIAITLGVDGAEKFSNKAAVIDAIATASDQE